VQLSAVTAPAAWLSQPGRARRCCLSLSVPFSVCYQLLQASTSGLCLPQASFLHPLRGSLWWSGRHPACSQLAPSLPSCLVPVGPGSSEAWRDLLCRAKDNQL